MDLLSALALVLFAASLGGVLAVFAGYPLCVWLTTRRRGSERRALSGFAPSVSLLVAVRNAAELVDEKVRNLLELDYPADKLEIVLVSDGSTDATEERIAAWADRGVTLVRLEEHQGKAAALNRGVAECRGELVVFTDVDALLERDALRRIAFRFADETVGGVCGQRCIGSDRAQLEHAQARYIQLDSALKEAESRAGSITSNDGKLYAIRRSLFRPIAGGATDDLYVCLNVVQQGFRFVFAPDAVASVRVPSRSALHELRRRRRIVARSLRGIFLMRGLLRPSRYGRFSVGLFVNKVVRRLLPVFLLLLLATNVFLAAAFPIMLVPLVAQVAFYGAALLHPLLGRGGLPDALLRPVSVAYYFCVGNAGTLLGLMDFLSGRETVKWEPLKSD